MLNCNILLVSSCSFVVTPILYNAIMLLLTWLLNRSEFFWRIFLRNVFTVSYFFKDFVFVNLIVKQIWNFSKNLFRQLWNSFNRSYIYLIIVKYKCWITEIFNKVSFSYSIIVHAFYCVVEILKMRSQLRIYVF